MPVIDELIRTEEDGSISFGNYKLPQKAKKSDFEYQGDLYKVKTYKEITKLERNDMFVYESVPGTTAKHFRPWMRAWSFPLSGIRTPRLLCRWRMMPNTRCM